jgi:peptidyl-dipeptidase A
MDASIEDFLRDHEGALRPLFREAHLALWESRTRSSPGNAAAAAEAEARYRRLYTDAGDAVRVEKWLREAGSLPPEQRRSLEFLRHSYLENAVSPEQLEELVEQAQDIATEFVTWRGSVDGKPVSSNDILEILAGSVDEGTRLQAWEASKSIGPRVADRLRALVRRRNQVARDLGFRDHYAMSLELQEIPEETLLGMAEELRVRTESPWRAMKARMDGDIARRLGVDVADLRPHHYDDPFVQLPPRSTGALSHLDDLFNGFDPVETCAAYFEGIGLPVGEVMARSDLYERPEKDQHAFCIDMDREGDVRILCNMRRDERWTSTLLHELGHAVYDLGFPPELPFLLRRPAHILTTEAVAQFFGRLTRDPSWLGPVLGVPATGLRGLEDPLREERSRGMLLFARWCLVMIHFERALYLDPDRPDLNLLWWTLVEELQGLRPPEGVEGRADWATKSHLAMAPVYYHNYILGEMLASQLHHRIRTHVLDRGGAPVEDPGVGSFLSRELFAPGGLPHWNEITRSATGAPLSVDAFLADFAGGWA